MKSRNTIFLLLLASAIFIYLFRFHNPESGTLATSQRAHFVTRFNGDAINAITIETSRNFRIRFEKIENHWRITHPINDRADDMLLTQLVTMYEYMNVEELIRIEGSSNEITEQHRDFGVQTPKMRVIFEGKNAPPEFLIGKETAISDRIYLRLEGSDDVYVVNEEARAIVNQKVDDYRDLRLTPLSPQEVDRVLIAHNAGEIYLELEDRLWNLTRPIHAEADPSRILAILTLISKTQIQDFIGDQNDLTRYGLSEPKAKLTLVSNSSQSEYSLHIGDPVPAPSPTPQAESSKTPAEPPTETTPDTTETDASPTPAPDTTETESTPPASHLVYAYSPERKTIFTIPDAILQIFQKQPNDFRTTKLLNLNPDVIDRIQVQPVSQPEIFLARDEDQWVIHNEMAQPVPADTSLIENLIASLNAMNVLEFVSDTASDLATYGLDAPAFRIIFSSYVSENTPTAPAGQSTVASLIVSPPDVDGTSFARVENTPFIVRITREIFDYIPQDRSYYVSRNVIDIPATDFEKILISPQDSPAIELQKNAAEWTLTYEEDSTDLPEPEHFLHALGTLKAVRWLGPVTPEHALSSPEFTITFTADATTNSLKIGKKLPNEDLWPATIGDSNFVFAITLADYQTLRIPLTILSDTPDPAPSDSNPPPSPAQIPENSQNP